MDKNIKKTTDILRWKRISRKTLFRNPRITLLEDEVRLPDGSKTSYLLFGPGSESVTVICIRNNEVLLQREYSYPPDEVLYQFPGGKIETAESPLDAAKRELSEESRLSPNRVNELGWYYVNNRRSNAKMHVVLAEELKNDYCSHCDKEENITSQWVPRDKFERMISEGKIVNFSVLAAWTLYKNKQQKVSS